MDQRATWTQVALGVLPPDEAEVFAALEDAHLREQWRAVVSGDTRERPPGLVMPDGSPAT